MVNPLLSYEHIMANQKEVTASWVVLDAVTAALTPFRATKIVMYLEQFEYETLFLEIHNLPGLKLKLVVDKGLLLSYPDSAYLDLARQAREQLEAMPRIEPPENVILGGWND